MKVKSQLVEHEFGAFFDENSQILILGSFPSVKSREQGFYYGHPQNRFWRVLTKIWGESTPQTIEEKKTFLLKNKIALWDVIERCEIKGSADASIKNAEPTDLSLVLDNSQVAKIFLNGRTAAKLYEKFHKRETRAVFTLPSTSPANATYSLERLIVAWEIIRK